MPSVYAARQEVRYRIGFVPSNTKRQLRVPANALELGGDLRLIVHRIGTEGGDYTTETVHVDVNQIAALDIAPNVELTTLAVWQK